MKDVGGEARRIPRPRCGRSWPPRGQPDGKPIPAPVHRGQWRWPPAARFYAGALAAAVAATLAACSTDSNAANGANTPSLPTGSRADAAVVSPLPAPPVSSTGVAVAPPDADGNPECAPAVAWGTAREKTGIVVA